MRTVTVSVFAAAWMAGCNSVLGLDAGELAGPSSGSGGAPSGATVGGAGGAGATAGSGGATSGGADGGASSSGRGGSSSAGGAGGQGGASSCTGCGPNETCNEATGLCRCGADKAAGPGEEACPDTNFYEACIDDVNGTRCGCGEGTCAQGFTCDLNAFECFCTETGCGPNGYCWPANSGLASGKCRVDEATCEQYGQVIAGGVCTCNDATASCED